MQSLPLLAAPSSLAPALLAQALPAAGCALLSQLNPGRCLSTVRTRVANHTPDAEPSGPARAAVRWALQRAHTAGAARSHCCILTWPAHQHSGPHHPRRRPASGIPARTYHTSSAAELGHERHGLAADRCVRRTAAAAPVAAALGYPGPDRVARRLCHLQTLAHIPTLPSLSLQGLCKLRPA
jgi:hypothetical protein